MTISIKLFSLLYRYWVCYFLSDSSFQEIWLSLDILAYSVSHQTDARRLSKSMQQQNLSMNLLGFRFRHHKRPNNILNTNSNDVGIYCLDTENTTERLVSDLL